MNIQLFFQAISKFVLGIVMIGVLLFLPAGSIYYWNGWLFMEVLFIPMFVVGIILMVKNPELLRRRLDVKEKEAEQKHVILLNGLMFLLGFIIAGFNYRYQWIVLPDIISYIAAVFFLIFYLLYAEVLRENTFLSRTIGVEENQKVIDTGFYSVLRHPMYAITIFLFLLIPLILGSLFSFFIFCIYPILIVKRIQNEEDVLEKELKGYREYQKKVKYKLIPFIW